jgi:outer membrane biosynthesis protein TonB
MKHPTGYAKPRRMAAPKTASKAAPTKKVRLDLKRRPMPEPEEDIGTQRQSHFWRWVVLVALLHVLAIGIFFFVYEMTPAPKPPEQFISLLPDGDVVKGTAGAQAAHKLGPTTPAPAVHHSSSPPPPAAAIQPPKPPTPPKPLPKPQLKLDAPPMLTEKPVTPPKPTPPKPPKVKVDLTLADGPAPDKPAIKPKPHKKKPVVKPDDSQEQDRDAATKADSSGLSKEEIAAKLGEKLDAAGVKNAMQTGTSGSANAHPNDFSPFTDSIRDQVMDLWKSPDLVDEPAVYPVVQIHIEKDGRVPPEGVHLIQSSGNSAYDDSAVIAAKSLGYLHEPLPDGCPPDIPITFKLTR